MLNDKKARSARWYFITSIITHITYVSDTRLDSEMIIIIVFLHEFSNIAINEAM